MHVLAKVASGGDEHQRRAWADQFIATLDTPTLDRSPTAPSQITPPSVGEFHSTETPRSNLKQHARRKLPFAIIGALAMGIAVVLIHPAFFSNSVTEPMRVAVMPFENLSETASDTYISAGITDDIIQSLTQVPDLYVTPRRNSRSLNRENLSMKDIGDALDVSFILDGTLRVDAGRMKLNAALIHIDTGEHIWSGKFDDQTSDLFSIQENVADGVTEALSIIMSPDRRARMFDFGTDNVEAYRQYLKGRHLMKFWHETHEGDDIWRAGEALEAAVAADPEMGRAWVHMTDLYHHSAADHIGPPKTPLNVTVPKTQDETLNRLRIVLEQGERHGNEITALQAKANRIFFSNDWAGLRPAVLEYAELVTPKRGELEWLYVPIMLSLLSETDAQVNLMDERVLRFDPGNGTGHAYVIRQYLTVGHYALAEKRLVDAETSTFSNRLAEVKGYMLVAERNGPALRAHINTSKTHLSPLLTDYFNVMAFHFNDRDNEASERLHDSAALKREQIHLALAHHHMGEAATAERIFAKIANAPIGVVQIAVQLSYGAACGPNPLPPIPPVEKRMAEAKMSQLRCIGIAWPARGSESAEK